MFDAPVASPKEHSPPKKRVAQKAVMNRKRKAMKTRRERRREAASEARLHVRAATGPVTQGAPQRNREGGERGTN